MVTTDTAGSGLADDERAELERLRAEVAELRAGAAPTPPTSGPDLGTAPRAPHHIWRWIGVGILIVLVAVLALTSVTTRFVRSQVLDTDRYVSTIAPIGSDSAVQANIADQITDEVFDRVDIETMTANALTALTQIPVLDGNTPRLDAAVVGLAPVIAGQAKNFVHDTVTQLVQSQQFEDLWIAANRAAHKALVTVVTGEGGPEAVQIDDKGTVSISLAPIIEQVKSRLAERGFAFADKIPAVDKQFVLIQSPDLVKAQRAVNALDKVATWLPWLTIAAAAAAVALAPTGRRLRALMLVGVALVVSMLLLAIGILIGRAVYLDNVPADVLTPGAATAVIDTLLVPLRTALRAVAVLGIVIAVVSYLVGGSRSAVAVRSGFGRGLDAVNKRRSGREPREFERWGWNARIPLRVAIVAVAAIALMFWRYPTGLVVGWIVVFAVLALVALEVLIRPARPAKPDEVAAA
ncbi:hypothetical protein OG921_01290 [Aldersonia sp. NBC_00410]|uniref:hypothetical protein n=1 Tax=Aldersonia sp. NBC_00410 TaxID=2975954 RepID=UPI002255E22A|nr:hypothetical protein [Aldersonia sp. NBC_00410]MCX5041826.1 hypothetical protein [Aldersonia sp. NBC_00410]